MNTKYLFLFVFAFVIGAVSAAAIMTNNPIEEKPFFEDIPREISSPKDTIKEDQIRVYKKGVFVELTGDTTLELAVEDASWSKFTDTNSMDPIIDVGANTIRIKTPCNELSVGDIISYTRKEGIIIHRIVHIDKDEKGDYFILKGDNNPTNDPGKVRCEQILGKIVAIIY